MIEFTCNICGKSCSCVPEQLRREVASCNACGSSVRTRSLIQALSLELFGLSLKLPEFPRVKSLRGLGLSDPAQIADGLARAFDYRNTFYDREPRLDITRVTEEDCGKFDFILSSEVLEHVPPPASTAFENALRLLKPGGVLLLTVPYTVESLTSEHYPELHEHGLAQVGGRTLLVNRTRDGRIQVFDDLVFHTGWGEPSLEMREYSESGLKEALAAAGFNDVRIHSGDCRPLGILHAEAWSLPVAARKGTFSYGLDATRDVVREWLELKRKHDAEMKRLDRALWFRIGRRLRLL
jgi:SAM-dependent methyltransferase